MRPVVNNDSASCSREFCNKRQVASSAAVVPTIRSIPLLISHHTFFFHYWAVGTSIGDVTYYKLSLSPLPSVPSTQHQGKAWRKRDEKGSLSSPPASSCPPPPVTSPRREIIAQILLIHFRVGVPSPVLSPSKISLHLFLNFLPLLNPKLIRRCLMLPSGDHLKI
jgi:hypothetical protein